MPKITNTRKQKAKELIERLAKGPAYSYDTFGYHVDGVDIGSETRKKIQKHFEDGYRRWAETWIIDVVKELVPELKEKV